jgi:hypothetical protein
MASYPISPTACSGQEETQKGDVTCPRPHEGGGGIKTRVLALQERSLVGEDCN